MKILLGPIVATAEAVEEPEPTATSVLMREVQQNIDFLRNEAESFQCI